ncbi:hypothetical protein ACJX0J_020045, partial [Zea mays]
CYHDYKMQSHEIQLIVSDVWQFGRIFPNYTPRKCAQQHMNLLLKNIYVYILLNMPIRKNAIDIKFVFFVVVGMIYMHMDMMM